MKSKETSYLSAEQLLLIHSMVIDETGGLHGVRDRGAVESAIALPQQKTFGHELHPGLFRKAAAYARSIISNHAFLDGNKRTGMAAAGVFLDQNGYLLEIKKGEMALFAVKIVTSRLDYDAIAAWLEKHSVRNLQPE